MPRIKYYSLDNILAKNAEYNIILGKRSNGKSYAVKHHCVKAAWENENHKFIVLRRLVEETKKSVIEHYFDDVQIGEISNGMCDNIIVYSNEVWACKYDPEKDKNKKIKKLGYIRALIKASQYKSGVYTDCSNIIYEEFICEVGTSYLADEPNELLSFVSTVARNNRIQVFMVGNTISRVCPYFTEWQLVNIPRQKQGTIDIYKIETSQLDDNDQPLDVTIAVENAENNGSHGKMFFGTANSMINEGAWHTSKMYPRLPKPRDECSLVYSMVMFGKGFSFLMELLQIDQDYTWYVTRKTTKIKPGTRVVTDSYSPSLLYTVGFNPLNSGEQRAFMLLKQGKVAFCDNLTAEEFLAVKANLGVY